MTYGLLWGCWPQIECRRIKSILDSVRNLVAKLIIKQLQQKNLEIGVPTPAGGSKPYPMFLIERAALHTRMMTFKQFVETMEGLWLSDRNALPGMSKINPFPATQDQLKRTRARPIKPPKPFTPPKPIKATITKVASVVPGTTIKSGQVSPSARRL